MTRIADRRYETSISGVSPGHFWGDVGPGGLVQGIGGFDLPASDPVDGDTLVHDGTSSAWAYLQALLVGSTISPAQLTANTDNWNPTGLSTAGVIRVSTDASRTLTGIVAPSRVKALILANVGGQDLVLKHNATSTAANRLYCPNDADYTLRKDSAVGLLYDTTSSRWRVIADISPTEIPTVPAFATPAIVLGTAAAAGSAGTVIRSDATIVAFDTTAPVNQAIGDVAATGSAGVAAHRDHQHGMPSAAAPSGGYGTAAAGSAATVLRSDAVLAKPTAPDVDFSADVTNNNATTGHHGLLPKLSGDVTQGLRGDGTFGSFDSGSSGASIVIGRAPYAGQRGFNLPTLAYTSAVVLATVSGGNGGAAALAIDLPATLLLQDYLVWCTDTAGQRDAEIRLYKDVGVAALAFVTGTDATISFTPAAAGRRTSGAVSGAPVTLLPGSYWLVIRNTSTARAFDLGSSGAGSGSNFFPANNFQTLSNVPALGSTLDLTNAAVWANGGAILGVALVGRVWGQSTAYAGL